MHARLTLSPSTRVQSRVPLTPCRPWGLAFYHPLADGPVNSRSPTINNSRCWTVKNWPRLEPFPSPPPSVCRSLSILSHWLNSPHFSLPNIVMYSYLHCRHMSGWISPLSCMLMFVYVGLPPNRNKLRTKENLIMKSIMIRVNCNLTSRLNFLTYNVYISSTAQLND